ncbi:apolipoprotein C-I [Clarias gariepinus]|uniref:apolipoprotein C-I n=1 Tax=Clarias gariepinus TaxID=13013 RepID=UPI00234E0ED2|nr:apolipoprotein C-I [Clarias gariepinus]
MRLYLAIAALMLVLIAHSEAAEEPTIEQHFANFHEKIKELGENFGEKATNAWRQLESSDFFSKSSDWFTEQFQNIKQKLDDTFNKPE